MLELNFQLNDGREISLEAFLQVKTYAGLLIGKPDASINRGILNSHEKLCTILTKTPTEFQLSAQRLLSETAQRRNYLGSLIPKKYFPLPAAGRGIKGEGLLSSAPIIIRLAAPRLI
jgi:hypothetical protein